MKKILGLIVAALAIALATPEAFAAASVAVSKQVLCAPRSVAALSPGRVTNPASGGGSYVLDTNGCALMVQGDWAYFTSQGYLRGVNTGQIFAGPYTAQSTTANSPILPANAKIDAIIIQETTGNALTGGIDIGVAGSSDATIVSGFAIGANAVINIPSASILKQVFPTSGTTGPVAQQIFFNAHTSWNSGSIVATIIYSYY